MPTLVTIEAKGPSFHASNDSLSRLDAADSGGGRQQQATRLIDVGNDSMDMMNDTTMSGSMLEEALQAMRIEQQCSIRAGSNDATRESVDHASLTGAADDKIRESNLMRKDIQHAENRRDISPHRHHARVAQTDRVMGPNETLYRQKYASKLNRWIDQGRARYPDRFTNYRSQSTPDKMKDQQRVMGLLSRLGIRGDDSSGDHRSIHSERSDHFRNATVDQLDCEGEPKLVSSPANSKSDTGDTTFESMHDPSALLFSPPIQQREIPKTPVSSVRFSGSTVEHSDSFSSETSIEHTRARSSADSPAAVHRKRMASMSGKRGADHVRIRTESALHSNSPTQDFFPMDDGSPGLLGSPMRGISPVRGNYFTASQSPISPRGTSPLYRVQIHSPMVPLDDSSDQKSSMNDSAGSADDSLMETRWESSRTSRNPFKESTRHNVVLKTGAVYHYRALDTTKHNSKGAHKFPNPLAEYKGSCGRRLEKVFERLQRRDSKDEGPGRAIIVSMAEQHIQDVTLKLLLLNPPTFVSQRNADSQRSTDILPLQGQTLIVVRDKVTVAQWSSTFREGSPFSVLDFLTLPVRQRKSHSTASKLAKYGVVLTTFDAVKASDVTHSIDEQGHVVYQTHGDGEGWFQSRDSVCRQTKQLTVLHCLSWRRVIFVDVVGRKC
jgi:hypothetical protein